MSLPGGLVGRRCAAHYLGFAVGDKVLQSRSGAPPIPNNVPPLFNDGSLMHARAPAAQRKQGVIDTVAQGLNGNPVARYKPIVTATAATWPTRSQLTVARNTRARVARQQHGLHHPAAWEPVCLATPTHCAPSKTSARIALTWTRWDMRHCGRGRGPCEEGTD